MSHGQDPKKYGINKTIPKLIAIYWHAWARMGPENKSRINVHCAFMIATLWVVMDLPPPLRPQGHPVPPKAPQPGTSRQPAVRKVQWQDCPMQSLPSMPPEAGVRLGATAYMTPPPLLPKETDPTPTQAAQHLGRAAWFITRLMLPQDPIVLLRELGDPPRPPFGHNPARMDQGMYEVWRTKLVKALIGLEFVNFNSDPYLRLYLSPYAALIWPSNDTLQIIEMQLCDEVLESLSTGVPMGKIFQTYHAQYQWPFDIVRDLVTTARSYAAATFVHDKDIVLHGMQSDLQDAHKTGDVRAKIAARKTLAQATGTLKSEAAGGLSDLAKIIERLGSADPENDPAPTMSLPMPMPPSKRTEE